jgi:asparagine N-glycosylation enzyme membrane subunit Stt3
MPLFNRYSAIFQIDGKRFPVLAPFIMVSLIAASSVYFRVHLSLHVDGDTFIGPDSYRHVRNVKQIISNGTLPEVDLMRHVPDGVKTTLETIGFPWVIAKSYGILNRFLPGLSLDRTMALYSVAAFVLSCFAFFSCQQMFWLFNGCFGNPCLLNRARRH